MKTYPLAIASIAAILLVVALGACVQKPPNIKALSVGNNHACSLDLRIDGVICWGDNSAGQTQVPNLQQATAISSGDGFSCAIDLGSPRCWGRNDQGQLNTPTTINNATAIASGDDFSCLIESGSLVCWGADDYGQISDMPALNGVEQIVTGAAHACARTQTQTLCWGRDLEGQLTPPSLTDVTTLSAGGNHSCAIDSSGLQCWGDTDLINPPAISQASHIDSGAKHACAIDAANGGTVTCWGDTSINAVLNPRNLTLPTDIKVGGNGTTAFACVRHQQGIACWGDNDQQQTSYDGEPYHSLYRAESVINAPADHVWAILMDLDAYPIWNPFTIAMESDLMLGSAMNMRVKMTNLITLNQTEYIRVLDDQQYKACWGINTNSPDFNSGERCQWLEIISPTQTRYITEDLVEGTSNPGVGKTFAASLISGFNGVATELKIIAEASYQTP